MLTYTPKPVRVQVQCENCQRQVDLLCEGLSGTAGYETFNEFYCPHCAKLSRARTPGAILSVSKEISPAP